MKLCKRCKLVKPLDCFDNDKLRKDLKYPYCKDCRRERNGSKKMVHRIIGYIDEMMVVDDERYPYVLTPNGAKRAHRYMMERKIGRSLEKGEVVHHIDGNKKNWDISNLMLMEDHRHRVMEGHINNGYQPVFTCTTCGKSRTHSSNVITKKVMFPERYQCAPCYYKSGGPGGRHKKLLVVREEIKAKLMSLG